MKRGNVDTGVGTEEECRVKMKAETGMELLQAKEWPRTLANHQELAERPGTDAPLQPEKEPTLLTPWSSTSSLQSSRQYISVAHTPICGTELGKL